jgi:hypothetical protein
MKTQFISLELGMYAKELGMGIEPISVVDIANLLILSSHFLFFQLLFMNIVSPACIYGV